VDLKITICSTKIRKNGKTIRESETGPGVVACLLIQHCPTYSWRRASTVQFSTRPRRRRL